MQLDGSGNTSREQRRQLGHHPESEPVRYGITHPLPSGDPWTVHVAEAGRLWVAWRRCPDPASRLRCLFGPPGSTS